MSQPRKSGESGFALLLVFLMAAVIAITLYMQIPRVAFQTQRQKEQLLIERGEQYKRAIQLFFRANNRYPAEIKDLENFNNRRFLRHRFVDPMTGKDDWRLVHINNGVFTDSVLNKKKTDDPNQKQDSASANSYVGVQPAIGETPQPGQQNLNPAQTRRRASEGGPATPTLGPDGQPIPPGAPITGLAPVPGQPFGGTDPNSNPAPGQPVSGEQIPGGVIAGQIPGQPFPGQPFPGTPTNPTSLVPPELANQPGLNPPGQPPAGQPFPGQPATANPFPGLAIPGRVPPGVQNATAQQPTSSYVGGSQSYVGGSQSYVGGGAYVGGTAPNPTPFTPGQVTPQPVPNQTGFPGTPATPFTPPAAVAPVTPGAPLGANPGLPGGVNPGAGMINNLLLGPRPAPTGAQPGSAGGQQIGGGIAGVASKSENAAIMVYSDRTNYNEWEFLFDYTKQQPLPNPNGGGGNIGTAASALGTVAGAPPAGATPSPVATPTAGAAIGANPNAAPGPGLPPQSQGAAAGKPQLPPNLRPGRP